MRKLAKINDEITHLRPRVSQSDRDLLLRQQVRDLLEASKSTSDFNSAISEEKSQPHQGWRQSLIAELIKLNGQLQNAPMNGLVLLNSKTSPPTYTSLMISTTTSSVWNETTVQSSTQVQKRKRKQNKSSVKVARLLKNLKSSKL